MVGCTTLIFWEAHMMKISFFRTFLVFSVAAIALAGCSRKQPLQGGAHSDSDILAQDFVLTDGDLPLGEAAFDQTHAKATDISAEPLYFGYDSYRLPPAEIAKIQKVAAIMKENADLVLIVEGHCDERGSNEYNLSLGEQRALAVRASIVTLGIAPERIQSRSFGEERPAASGTGEAVWCLNRRGEFAFYR